MVLSKPDEEKDMSGFMTTAKKIVIGFVIVISLIQIFGRISASQVTTTDADSNVFLPPELISLLNQALDALLIVGPILIGIVLFTRYYQYKLGIKNTIKNEVA